MDFFLIKLLIIDIFKCIGAYFSFVLFLAVLFNRKMSRLSILSCCTSPSCTEFSREEVMTISIFIVLAFSFVFSSRTIRIYRQF